MEDDLTIADLRIESDADSLLPGSKLHSYRIDSVLGQGDYWFTYLASDLNLGRPVIITEYMPCEIAIRDTRGVIHPAPAEHGAEYKAGLESFLTDAQKLAGIRHQNIAQALNAFEANNSAYIVVAQEQGKKAEHLFDGSTVAEKELLAFVLPILDGLEAIHASGYIHRYIQPPTIIIRPDGSPVLTGLHPGGGALFNPANTLTKHFPSDFAPIELCFGDGELHGPWTDIFSLGAMLYQAVVGVAPVAAIERSRVVVQGGTDPLMSVLPVGQGNYSDAFLKAIDHALGFLPTQRPLTVATWRNELSGKDSLGVAFVIRPESEQVVKLRQHLEAYKLRSQEDHKRRAAERTHEEERTVKKLLHPAGTAISEHNEAAGIAPKSEAVASLRDELKARETAVVQQGLVEETLHLQAEENANKLAALGRGRTGKQARPAVGGRRDGKLDSIPGLNRSLQPADVPVTTPITNDRVRSAVDPSDETAGGSPLERDVRGRHRGAWLGYSAAIAGIAGLGLSLAWMDPGSFASLYGAADEWLSGNLFREEPTETIPKPAPHVPVPEHPPRLDQDHWDAARTRLDEAAVIAPESEAVAGLRDELKARATRQISIREVTPSLARVRPGETVRFYTTYSLSLPESDTEAHVKATWVLLRGGRKIGRAGIDNRYARAGLNTAVTELTLPPRTASGQYTVEHRVQVGNSFDVAHSRFVLAR
ncbi:MAG: protein kinase domain-containing protein [Gammaproteobacteria bacterium]